MHPHSRRRREDVPSKRLPAEVGMVDDIRAHLERVPDEVGTVVARVPVPLERVLERVEGRGREAALVDVGERAAEPAEADAEEVVVVGRGAELRDERDGVQAAAVVVDLALDALELPSIDVVPIRDSVIGNGTRERCS